MDWETCKRLNWDLLWLLGGGYALAAGIEQTGLAEWIGLQMQNVAVLPPELILVTIVTIMVFVTEIIANTAAAQICIPILAGLSREIYINPFYLCIPATFAASCAFMLPTATGPNSVIFGYGVLNLWDMISSGLFLNFLSILVLPTCWFAIGQWVYNADPRNFPDWAINSTSTRP